MYDAKGCKAATPDIGHSDRHALGSSAPNAEASVLETWTRVDERAGVTLTYRVALRSLIRRRPRPRRRSVGGIRPCSEAV